MPPALHMFADLRSALRAICHAKRLTAMLVLTLALGVGVNTAVGRVVYALLLRAPAGVESAGSLVAVYTSEFSGAPYGRTSLPDYLALAAIPMFESVAATDDSTTANVALRDVRIPVRTAEVTTNYFTVLRMTPYAGRLLTGADGAGTRRGAVVSANLANHFGGIEAVLGQLIDTHRGPFIVVGVTPPKFRGLQASRVTDLWLPLAPDDRADRGDRKLFVIGRTYAPHESVQHQLHALHEQLAAQYPDTNRGAVTDPAAPRRFTPVVYSVLEPDVKVKATLIAAVVVGAVALLLVSACVNAGTLLFSRAMSRRREFAVRIALGASRRRLVRQLLAESLLVSLTAGALGLMFAHWMSRALPSVFAPEHAELLDMGLDPLLIVLTFGIAALAGVVFGIVPAVRGTGAPATLALRADAGGISQQYGDSLARGLLISAQVGLSTVLLIGTTLLTASLARALEGDSAAAARKVAVLQVGNPGGECTFFDTIRGATFQQQVAEMLPKSNDVRAVGFAGTAPLGRGNLRQYAIRAGAAVTDRMNLRVTVVSAGYFGALGISAFEGRTFNAGDGPRAEPVAIIDESLARRYFGLTAVGKHLLDANGESLRVVGVVRRTRYRTLQDTPQPTVYVPLTQEHFACGYLFVRTTGDPAPLLPVLVSRVKAVDPGVTITRATTLEQLLSESLVIDRLTTTLVGVCGIISLLMAAIGVYGVMSDAVIRRTREIGLRTALGADPPQIAWLVFRRALQLTAGGALAGSLASLLFERVAATLMYGLPRVEWVTICSTIAALAIIVALAAALPLRRALAVSPTVALRAE